MLVGKAELQSPSPALPPPRTSVSSFVFAMSETHSVRILVLYASKITHIVSHCVSECRLYLRSTINALM